MMTIQHASVARYQFTTVNLHVLTVHYFRLSKSWPHDINNVNGTDIEHKLIKAVSDAFPNTKLLQCVMHFLSNLKDHAKSAGAEKVVSDLQHLQLPYQDFDNLWLRLVSKYHEHASLINFLLKSRDLVHLTLHPYHDGGTLFALLFVFN